MPRRPSNALCSSVILLVIALINAGRASYAIAGEGPSESPGRPEAMANDAKKIANDLCQTLTPKSLADDRLREAIGKNGAIYRGIFERAGEYYKLWPTESERQQNPRGYRTLRLQDLASQPGPSIPLECARQYNDQLAILRAEPTSLARWRAFLKACRSLEEHVDGYLQQGEEADLSFLREIIAAEVVLDIGSETSMHIAGGARKTLTDLANSLPAKPEGDRKTREAIGKNREVYRGVFEPAGEYYKVWETEKERRANPRGYRTILPQDLARRPQTPAPLCCASKYNRWLAFLKADPASLRRWEVFLDECSVLQSRVDAYLAQGGQADLSFKAEIDVARKAIESGRAGR